MVEVLLQLKRRGTTKGICGAMELFPHLSSGEDRAIHPREELHQADRLPETTAVKTRHQRNDDRLYHPR